MKRHRGKFDPNNDQPYELSRSRIENFFKCPACFYMQQVEGIVFPSIPYLLELMTQKNSQNGKGMRVKLTHIFLIQ